jgi:hypothetical protein
MYDTILRRRLREINTKPHDDIEDGSGCDCSIALVEYINLAVPVAHQLVLTCTPFESKYEYG